MKASPFKTGKRIKNPEQYIYLKKVLGVARAERFRVTRKTITSSPQKRIG